MTLNAYLTNAVARARQEVRYSTIEVWKEVKTQISVNDAYSRLASIASGSRMFSGSLGWSRTLDDQRTPGGSFYTGEMRITAALSEKTGGNISLTDDGVYLVAEGIKFKIIQITEARETKDMLLVCNRISEPLDAGLSPIAPEDHFELESGDFLLDEMDNIFTIE